MNTHVEFLTFENPLAWRSWLSLHHATAKEAWVIHYKKGLRPGSLTYEQALDEALCFGWIDGLLQRVDEERFALRYSPRKPGSVWSAGNVQRVERLIREGRLTEAGLQKIREAQANGEWAAALQREDTRRLPPDLEEALQAHPGSMAAFEALTASQKKSYIWWVTDAKREATRQKRIQTILDGLDKK